MSRSVVTRRSSRCNRSTSVAASLRNGRFSLRSNTPPRSWVTHRLSTLVWIPVENEFENQLLIRLINEHRSFVKALHHNLSRRNSIANVLLTDTASPVELHIVSQDHDLSAIAPASEDESANATQHWAWNPWQQALPALPVKKTRIQPICEAN